jgi:hypothetical protein
MVAESHKEKCCSTFNHTEINDLSLSIKTEEGSEILGGYFL